MSNWKDPIHPGEILADELAEIGMTALELGKRLGVPKNVQNLKHIHRAHLREAEDYRKKCWPAIPWLILVRIWQE